MNRLLLLILLLVLTSCGGGASDGETKSPDGGRELVWDNQDGWNNNWQ